MFAQPDHMSSKLVDKFRRCVGIGKKITASDIGLALQGQCDRIARLRVLERTVKGNNLLDPGAAA